MAYLGIDIGGTTTPVCLVSKDGELLSKEAFLTNQAEGPKPCVEQILLVAESLLKQHCSSPMAIGIACGSPLDPEQGIIQAPPNLSTWIDVPIVSLVEERLKIPTYLENDANAGACAEYCFGAGVGSKNMIFLTFGTGMGAGIILNGELYRGTNFNAGEVGHMRLAPEGPVGYHKAGSFEGFCSGGGIAQLAASLYQDFRGETVLSPTPTTRDVGEAAVQGDPLAREVLALSGQFLGKGLALLIDILNPERIVIGSIFERCEEFLRPAMQEVLEQEALPSSLSCCEIMPAKLGDTVGDFAAVSVARMFHLSR